MKNSKYLFLFLCIPIRLLFSYILKNIDKKYLKYISILLFLQGISFLYLYFWNKRLDAVEAGGHTWWSEYRLLHGVLYICSSIYAYQEKNISWIPLFIDVLFGLLLFLYYRM